MSRFTRLVLALTAGFGLLIGAAPAGAKDTNVAARDNYFSKPLVVITAGDSVTWRNQGVIGHTVVTYPGAPRAFDSSPGTEDNCRPLLGSADCMEPGDTYGVTFTKAGTYEYYCKIAGHADPSVRPDQSIKDGREQPCGMCGVVVVNKKPEPPEPTNEPEQPTGPTSQPSPSPSPTETSTASPTPTETGPDGSPIAIDETGSSSGDGSGGRIALAFGAIVILGGTGYVVWRRYLNA